MKLTGSVTKDVSGWNLNVDHGPWNQNAAQWNCGKAGWFGWSSPGVGSINTILHGNGHATLEFGNCHTGGNVGVYLDGKEIAMAGPNSEQEITFVFLDGSSLELRELNTGIIQFNHIQVSDCPDRVGMFSQMYFCWQPNFSSSKF